MEVGERHHMSKPLFVPSKLPPFEDRECWHCMRIIAEVADGSCYFSVNRVRKQNICRECYKAWNAKRNNRGVTLKTSDAYFRGIK